VRWSTTSWSAAVGDDLAAEILSEQIAASSRAYWLAYRGCPVVGGAGVCPYCNEIHLGLVTPPADDKSTNQEEEATVPNRDYEDAERMADDAFREGSIDIKLAANWSSVEHLEMLIRRGFENELSALLEGDIMRADHARTDYLTYVFLKKAIRDAEPF
jgi:hypothetical protein